MANIKISELNELYGHQRAYDDYIPVVDSSADETKKISVGSLIPNNVNIIAVTDTAPVEYETGDKYYNTEENKIYTATSWGWENPQTPIGGILYVILADQKTYTYDGDNETLISVGGGGGGGIAVYPDEPEEDTKLYIESTDLDGQYLPIEEDVYSTNEVKTNKVWIDGKPIYRQAFTGTINNNSTLLTGIDTLIAGYGTVSMGQNERLVGYFEIDSNKNYFCHLRKNGTTVYFTCVYESVGYNPTNCNVVVEYTKTTD